MAQRTRFSDYVAPPTRHRVENQCKSTEKDRRISAKSEPKKIIIPVHPEHSTGKHDEGPNSANNRPRTGINEVVIMLDFSSGHYSLPVVHGSIRDTISSCRRARTSLLLSGLAAHAHNCYNKKESCEAG